MKGTRHDNEVHRAPQFGRINLRLLVGELLPLDRLLAKQLMPL